eukprot:CAMPEP_0195525014 /NCGR_PEP_ID=MMETSP0794_2-20130614/25192_1 /TAXON_ID=515487 /ORGANISM="Stephanopyxis turris, Strain CCMP 815" /LENGTH=337 /DNA_ID=CAMNT_0040655365 /DNA_START=88 /DNA_END=1101 /DNA_ORIENTATION=-
MQILLTICVYYVIPFSSGFSLSPNSVRNALSVRGTHITETNSRDRSLPSTNKQPIRGSRQKLEMAWYDGKSNNSKPVVPVRIVSPTRNSRRIMGEITVEAPLEDVWAILTDYDNLSTHVPNLVESRQIQGFNSQGEQGDGSYKCRLFQKGAQKIIGFEFGASVTMDMAESVIPGYSVNGMQGRKIAFKCVESQFFSEFDGEWTVEEVLGQSRCKLNYAVLVKPKGPVPVMALEWRIREDVPINLLSVKKAAMEVGYEGVMAVRNSQNDVKNMILTTNVGNRRPRKRPKLQMEEASNRVRNFVGRLKNSDSQQYFPAETRLNVIDWNEDETMAAYLNV